MPHDSMWSTKALFFTYPLACYQYHYIIFKSRQVFVEYEPHSSIDGEFVSRGGRVVPCRLNILSCQYVGFLCSVIEVHDQVQQVIVEHRNLSFRYSFGLWIQGVLLGGSNPHDDMLATRIFFFRDRLCLSLLITVT